MSAGEKLRFWPPILSQIAQGRVKRRVMEKAIANLRSFKKDCPFSERTVLIRSIQKESCSVRAPGRKLWKRRMLPKIYFNECFEESPCRARRLLLIFR